MNHSNEVRVELLRDHQWLEHALTELASVAAGGEALRAKVALYKPRCLAVLGVGAYRSAFGRPKAVLGRQPEGIGQTLVWVLPNPSGLNAHYGAAALARLFGELREAVAG